jgi:hypothetical protein
LWLLANPLWTHGIGESASKATTGWLSMGAASANPFADLLLHLNFYCIMHLPFGNWNMFFLSLSVFPLKLQKKWH